MKSRCKSKNAQVKAVLNRVLVVAREGVDFSFYQCWYDPPSERELRLEYSENELALLEIELDKAI